jgi:UDP-N-acetylglucosamine--N-acetylmuramyl-(pentapeptide) pyrophosphoryl-undecaprenol N-acetylglucosamine transferase
MHGASVKSVVLIAGGGTGGHVYPGLALAKAFEALASVCVVFAGTARGLEAQVVPAAGYPLETLNVEPMKGGGARRFIRGGAVAALAAVRAQRIIARRRPRAVVSIGGYAAGPICLAAALRGIPVMLVEPNAVIGFTNRMLAPLAKRTYVAWERVVNGERKARVLGVPIRAGFQPFPQSRSAEVLRILVLGGSQGSQALNHHVPLALTQLSAETPICIVHQTGKRDVESVEAAYRTSGLTEVQVVSYLEDTAQAIRNADLVVSRAGASTVAEITAIGRPAVFIPFARAADDHQTLNALQVVMAGGARMVTEAQLARGGLLSAMQALTATPVALAAAAHASQSCGKPHAARDIAKDILDYLGIATATVQETA